MTARFLQYPKSRNVFEEADCILNAALVCEVLFKRFFVYQRLFCLRTEQRPCAARNVAALFALFYGSGNNGGRRVVRAYRDNVYLRYAEFVGNVFRKFADNVARRSYLSEQTAFETETVDHVKVPVSLFRIQQLAGGSNGIFNVLFSRQQICEKVGHEQQRLRSFEHVGTVQFERIKMIKRVDVQELYARFVVKLVLRNDFENFLHNALCSLVSVMNGVFKQFAVLVKQSEIDAPCVYAYRGYVPVARIYAFENTLFYFMEQS